MCVFLPEAPFFGFTNSRKRLNKGFRDLSHSYVLSCTCIWMYVFLGSL